MEPRRKKRIVVGLTLLLLWVPIFLVARHSVEEIHYLKTFLPSEMTPSEAKDAAVIELIKVAIIVLPLLIAMAFVWKMSREE
ncbi:hypothetical protein [Candidatus Manganitrophus noduliformans]|uniref:Uncharacterized protein n=1 Tax=Candidatus Manganitrophus noduliformans TaxID=2606439 RepID=A0A7X6DQI6_9BACT|nr:hypothetical protein [Candidatus Manganitrophus noduliformans]NKE71521.1 hypothetical protein [Candidatus Manganitrophus noduliformans]